MFCLRFGRVERFYQASSCGWYATGNTFSPGMNRHYIGTFIYSTQELACSIGDKQTMLLHFFSMCQNFPSLPVFSFFFNLECVKNKMAAIRHHTFELRQEERSGTDRLRAPYARDRFPPPTRSSDALLFTGSLVVRVCVSVGVEGGFKGSFCTITSRS